MADEQFEEPKLALLDYLDAHRFAFNPLLNGNSSDLAQCINFFEIVAKSKASITSQTNSNDTGKFIRDMQRFASLQTVEEMRTVIREWATKFRDAMEISSNPTDDAMDVDTPRDGDDPPRISGVKRRLELSEEGPLQEHVPEDDAIDPAMLLDIAGVKRRREGEKDDTAWKQQVPPPSTRAETARQLEETSQPTEYLAAEKVLESHSFKSLKRRIRKDLKELISQGLQYWPSFKADPKRWEGCDPRVMEHVNALNIPTVPLRRESELPDLLLHRLGCLDKPGPAADMPPLDAGMKNRLDDLLADPDDCSLKNAAGVGKTRMLFELLAKRFGIYINFAHSATTNPYGSCDTVTARNLVEFGMRNIHRHHIYFQPTVNGFGSDADKARRHNEHIVRHLYELLVFARVLVFDWFLELYQKHQPGGTSAIRLWCMLQIRPQLRTSHDVFDEVFQSLLMVERSSCETTLRSIFRSCENRGGIFRFIILDEVHVPAAEFTTAFTTFTAPAAGKPPKTRPLLKAVLLAVREALKPWKPRLLVASTEFNDAIINEAIGSTNFKPQQEAPNEVTDFGDYSEPSSLSHVMGHFLGPDFVSSIPGLLRSHIDFWLPGRRRYLSTFIQWIIHQGPTRDNMFNVLRQLVAEATGSDLYAKKFNRIPGFSVRPLIPEKLRQPEVPVKFLATRQKLQHAVTYFIIKGIFPAWDNRLRRLVTLGLGCFVPDPDANGKEIVTIKESLVLMALMHWLIGTVTGETSLKAFLDQAMANMEASSRGYAFEDVLMFVLWQTFTNSGAPLDKVFKFRHLPPSWKNETAKLIHIFKNSSPNGKPYPLISGLTTRIGYAAQSAAETRAWFMDSDVRRARIPFLQPDKDCGPDLMFGLLMRERIELLVSVQCKCWSTLHYGGDVLKAVQKLAPEGIYSTKRSEETARTERNREKLLKLLEQFPATEKLPMPKADKEPKYSMIRVLATFESSVAWPTFDETWGEYPIASLSDEFLKSSTLEFSALERAYDSAKRRKGPTPLL